MNRAAANSTVRRQMWVSRRALTGRQRERRRGPWASVAMLRMAARARARVVILYRSTNTDHPPWREQVKLNLR